VLLSVDPLTIGVLLDPMLDLISGENFGEFPGGNNGEF
jgi:hypothetical protein